jgi:hypothetical protein
VAIGANWLLTATVSRASRPILPTVIAEVGAAFSSATAPNAFRAIADASPDVRASGTLVIDAR